MAGKASSRSSLGLNGGYHSHGPHSVAKLHTNEDLGMLTPRHVRRKLRSTMLGTIYSIIFRGGHQHRADEGVTAHAPNI